MKSKISSKNSNLNVDNRNNTFNPNSLKVVSVDRLV